MSSATVVLVVLIGVMMIAGFVIVLLRPRNRDEPKSENSSWFSQSAIAPGPSSHHDAGFHSPPVDAPSLDGADGGGSAH